MAEIIRVRGLVQGVGFRPTVWRLARDNGLQGEVLNDSEGVLIRVWGEPNAVDGFVRALETEAPPLAHIDAIERYPGDQRSAPEDFRITLSQADGVHTGVVPDAAVCPACVAETLDPGNRRYRYPFTNCTHCGPRLSIIRAIPYDRLHTSMAVFRMCTDCQAEYDNPADRRFHAQPNACPVCGPQVRLIDADAGVLQSGLDELETVCRLLQQGNILAIKGIGGVHLACDAGNEQAVQRLRTRKRRYHKPFALMARDLEMVQRYCEVSQTEQRLLQSAQAPIVILSARDDKTIASAVAPGQSTLGVMLPYSPLHHLILQAMERPIVLTSGNRSEEPQCSDNAEAQERLHNIADYWLLHNRDIVNRVDDSVVRVMAGAGCLLRRARGYAPASLPLPPGLTHSPQILALGGELKNTFCLLKEGMAILSQHMGDLEDAATQRDYRHNLKLYHDFYQHEPQILAVDKHPDYLSTKLGQEWAERERLELTAVQHHHAHIAACMAENGIAYTEGPVLGVALDGLGYGDDGTFWGGEFLLADYRNYRRLGAFKPVAMLGGSRAIREPWRNTYAQLVAGWSRYRQDFADLELLRYLQSKPLDTLNRMLERGLNCPLTSSCGRLFDAVAAAIGVCREQVGYEGQAAVELEALVDPTALQEDAALAYSFTIVRRDDDGLFLLEPLTMWQALLQDLRRETAPGVMAARFHQGLARAIVAMVVQLSARDGESFAHKVALSGGVFQNKRLLEWVMQDLQQRGFSVLSQHQVPANDGGLSLGQAVIAAARSLYRETTP